MNKMKYFTFLGIAIFGLLLSSTAQSIDLQTAETVASKFMNTNDLRLASTYKTERNDNALYIFNTTDGFVIVAADECETPIVAYSHEGRFDATNIPVQMEEYLQDFVAKIDKEIVFLQPISQ